MLTAMYFHIFVKKRCKFCSKAKQLLEEKGLPYVISHMDKAPGALKELKEHCQWKTVPIIFEITGSQEALIGGYTDLEEYLNGTQEDEQEEGRGEGTDNGSSD